MIDTHCHLDSRTYEEDRDDVVKHALNAGVSAMVTIGIDPDSWRRCQDLDEANESIVRAAGLHPNSVEEWWSDRFCRELADEIEPGELVAIGETGLDFFRDSSQRPQQEESFRMHLELSQQYKLPVIIHQREALSDVLHMLDETPPMGGVLHCFTGSIDDANDCIERGLYLGIGGIVTFPNAKELQGAVRRMPIDRLLLETDAPYLAPQGRRGKRNEPAYVAEVAEKVAELRDESLADVISKTSQNAVRLFGQRLGNAMNGTGRQTS